MKAHKTSFFVFLRKRQCITVWLITTLKAYCTEMLHSVPQQILFPVLDWWRLTVHIWRPVQQARLKMGLKRSSQVCCMVSIEIWSILLKHKSPPQYSRLFSQSKTQPTVTTQNPQHSLDRHLWRALHCPFVVRSNARVYDWPHRPDYKQGSWSSFLFLFLCSSDTHFCCLYVNMTSEMRSSSLKQIFNQCFFSGAGAGDPTCDPTRPLFLFLLFWGAIYSSSLVWAPCVC